ncbi:MAG: hypothetical protein L0Z55_00960 [Planctomycetes bacterium]|nr:hypothetical protein [Planctomycetota bacterium]
MKDALRVADSIKDADLKLKLAAVQMECAKLSEDNAQLRQELVDLRKQAEVRQEMDYANDVYWRVAGEGKRDGPFCPKCLDGKAMLARMSNQASDRYWRCHVCDHVIEKSGRGSPRNSPSREDKGMDFFGS